METKQKFSKFSINIELLYLKIKSSKSLTKRSLSFNKFVVNTRRTGILVSPPKTYIEIAIHKCRKNNIKDDLKNHFI